MRPRKSRSPVRRWAMAGSSAIARNPLAVGGSTAFLVTFAFVSANALWYQPYGHPQPFFETRAPRLEKPRPTDSSPARPAIADSDAAADREPDIPPLDPRVGEVQEILRSLRLYDGPVDGISGPKTREAIMHYQRVVGLEQTGRIDAALLGHLGATGSVGELVPHPRARPKSEEVAALTQADGPGGDPTVRRIQAGLRAFGNAQVTIDGIAGAKTEAAIREFQALFGLEVDGRADEALLARMRALGLAD